MKTLCLLFLLFASSFHALPAKSMSAILLASTESDPDAFIQNCCNAINGDYCESAVDLRIAGPDELALQRHYNNKNYITGEGPGGWRIFPQAFLVMGKDPNGKRQKELEWIYAYTGERSGGILTYSGWKNIDGDTKDPLKINAESDCMGMVNTYAAEINGRTNHLSNRIECKGETCELTLGDGTRRLYEHILEPPNELFGEKLLSTMASKVQMPQYFRLTSETLPSGNIIYFSYNERGHLSSVEMRNAAEDNIHSWIHFTYHFHREGCTISLTTSDEKTLTYEFENINVKGNPYLTLKKVQGSHSIPVSYQYKTTGHYCLLKKKILPEGSFLEIEYDNQKRVQTLKSPHAQSGRPTLLYDFSYKNQFTDVTNAAKIKTRYRFDKEHQLIAVEQFDKKEKLYRSDLKYFDNTLLIARCVGDGQGDLLSYRSFKYDERGNPLEERLYGNLTGKKKIHLEVDSKGLILKPNEEECHIKKFTYSDNGFNLLTSLGDCKGNQTTYLYEQGSNRLSRKLIYDGNSIRKREFRFYNDDAVCIKIVEDDGIGENIDEVYRSTYSYFAGQYNTEKMDHRYISEIHPKQKLPGIGLPKTIEKRAYDIKTKQEILIKKLINTYSPQGDLLSCATYDAEGRYAYTVSKTYDHLGQITSEADPEGKVISYSYDKIGNRILVSIPHEQKSIETKYNRRHNPIQVIENAGNLHATQEYTYDKLDQKITSTDRFGQTTRYEYDDLGRLTRLIHPTVLDEHSKPIQPTFSYAYDIFGNALTTTDPKGYTTQKAYNLRGDPSKIDYPDGTFELFKYDPEGSLHRSLTRDGIITVYEYDYLGRVVHEEVSLTDEKGGVSYHKTHLYEYNGFHLLKEKDGHLETELKYDPSGKTIEVLKYERGQKHVESESHKLEIIYDSLGRESKKKVWFDVGQSDYSLECFEYDLFGNILEKRIEDANGSILLAKYYSYDTSGRRVEESSCQNPLLKTSYDPWGEPISYLDALNNETKIITKYGKNALTKTVIGPQGVQTIFQFDALARVTSTTKKDSKGKLLSSEEILYDALGNKSVEIHAVIIDGKQVSNQKTRWVYGPMNRAEQLIEAEGSPEEKETLYTYNDRGQLKSKLLPGTEKPISYTYDKRSWISKIEYSDDKKNILSNSFYYDRRGNITSASTADGKQVVRTYNIFDQILEENIIDGHRKYALKFQYDRKGRLKSIILPDQSSIAYTYDAAFGRKVTHLAKNGEELYSHTYDTYDLSGKLIDETLIAKCDQRQTRYDPCENKISISTDFHKEIVPENGYDALGHLLTVEKEGKFPLESGSYAYNALSKLISEKHSVHKTYSYDSLDNRLAEDQEKLLYNSLNQLIAKSNTDFEYDTQGNLLRKTLEGEETHFESNILSQLVSIKKPDGSSLSFSYDPFGRRIAKKSSRDNRVAHSFYFGHYELGVLDEKGDIQKLRIPGISGDTISLKSVAIKIKEQVYAVLHDISGNICALIDPQIKNIVESYSYSAFGTEKIYNANHEMIPVSDVGNPWRYAEKTIDEETGLIYFGLRYYDPEIGRWISQDPLGYTQGPNFYAYCSNDPLSTFDRFGLEAERDSSELEEYFYGEVETHCCCERHRTCKRGGDLDRTNGSQLPTVTYCETFEQMYPRHKRSIIFDLSLEEIDNIGVGFINGAWNDFDGAYQSAQYLSELAEGSNIHAVFNATHGKYPDLKECRMGLKYIATEPVKQLHRMWNNFFERSSLTAKFMIICHSQGAIHVRNALLDYPPDLRKRILVVAIAPAAYIYKESCAHVIHYRSDSNFRDPIPYTFDPEGAQREVDTIVNLEPHPEANRFDHNFNSPTYTSVIMERIDDYINGRIL